MMENLSDEDFFRLVQNPATRLTNASDLIRLSLIRLESKSADLFSRCAAFCVIGYRYLEYLDQEEFCYLTGVLKVHLRLISADLNRFDKSGLWFRWYTSFTMAAAYVELAQGNYDVSLGLFKSVASNSKQLQLWAQMTTNHVAACLFAGCLSASRNNRDTALELFNKSGEVFTYGVELLDLNSYWMTTELQGALAYLCESVNEREFLLTGARKHEVGKYLAQPIKKMLQLAINVNR